MAKYIINHTVAGYNTIGIEDAELLTMKNNIVVIVLDESSNGRLMDYYSICRTLMINNNKLIIILVGKESKIRKSICILAANYYNYNIYKIDSKSTITNEYLEAVIDREPTFDEVQTFIGGDVSGYADLSIILTGIETFAREGNIEGLKEFIESRVNSVESLSAIADYMKKIVDTATSGELLKRISELKSDLVDARDRLSVSEKEVSEAREESLKLKEANDSSTKEIKRLSSEVRSLRDSASSDSSGIVIHTYSPIQTQVISCRAKTIIYFKEISYVQYMNSLVYQIMECLKILRYKAKLLIFDGKVGINGLYKPLSIVSGSEFVNNKDTYITQTDKFVVVEPNRMILESILTNMNPQFDVVIVYDRLKQTPYLVEGNNVVKYWVVNSSREYAEIKPQLQLMEKDREHVITRVASSIGPDVINIPTISDYNTVQGSQSAKTSKYRKLASSTTGKLIIDAILSSANINPRKRGGA